MSTNNTGSSVNCGGETSPINIKSPSNRTKGRKATKLAKRSNDKIAAIAIEESSLEREENGCRIFTLRKIKL